MFTSSLIKKRRYWQKYIKGDNFKAHISDHEVVIVDAWSWHLDGVKLHTICMKEPDCVLSLKTMYGTTELMGNARPCTYEIDDVKRRKNIVYPEVV